MKMRLNLNFLTQKLFLVIGFSLTINQYAANLAFAGINFYGSQIEKVIATPAIEDCSTARIFDCLKNSGGKACLRNCSVNENLFCSVKTLNSCLKHRGGSGLCYAKSCDGGGEGKLDVTSLPGGGWRKMPTQGIGYIFYIRNSNHMWATAKTVARMEELAKRVFRKTGYPLLLGDFSKKGGGYFPPHKSHRDGRDVDIAVMGNTTKVSILDYRHSKHYFKSTEHSDENGPLSLGQYLTLVLVEEAKAIGGFEGILYQDPRLYKFGHSINWPGHKNHIHIDWE